MQNNLLEVSVVVCAYTLERWEDLQQAIRSLQDQTVRPREIVLVIDHNPALEVRASQTFKEVVVIDNHESSGLSGARNSGIAHCTGQIIAFMDEDAVAAPDWIETLLNSYRFPNVIGVGGEVKPSWVLPRPEWHPEEFAWVVGCSYKGLPQAPTPVRNLIGCNMSFRREALENIGGFRNGIGRVGKVPVGCEETELCIRVRQLSPMSAILYQPEAVVYHKVPTWRASWRYFAARCYAEGLSKAIVTRFVGSKDGLSNERKYVLKTLPQGFFNGLADTLLHGRLPGLKRSFAIAAGLALTTAGYLAGILDSKKVKSSNALKSAWFAKTDQRLEEN